MATKKPAVDEAPFELTNMMVMQALMRTLGKTPLPRNAAPENDLAESIDLPLSTYQKEKAEGRGPRVFRIGRRNYILLTDWTNWLEQRAGANHHSGADM